MAFPRTRLRYETALKANKFLLVVHATKEELMRAKDILADTEAASIEQTFTRSGSTFLAPTTRQSNDSVKDNHS